MQNRILIFNGRNILSETEGKIISANGVLSNLNENIYDFDEYVAKETINNYYFSGIPFRINTYGNTPEIAWQPNSLKQALDMAFGFMLCSEQNPIKICKHCGKAFTAPNPKTEYDTFSCKNQENVYKSRAKASSNVTITEDGITVKNLISEELSNEIVKSFKNKK